MARALAAAVALLTLALALAAPPVSARDTPTPDAAAPVAVPEPTPRAVHFHYTGLGLWIARRAWDLAVPLLWITTGTAATLATRFRRWQYLPGVLAFTAAYDLITTLLSLPWIVYLGYVRPRDYGLGTQDFADFLADELKSFVLGLLLTLGAVGGVYALIRHRPRTWWLWAGLAVVPIALALTFVLPIWIDPLFHEYGPMRDRELEAQVLALADRAGVSDAEVYVVDMSRETRAVNAYVTGLLGTKRIVLWDTLLARLEPDEVLAVVGHELGHYVLNHVVQGVLVGSGLTLLGLAAVAATARRLVPAWTARWSISRLDEPASLPVLLLLAQLASLALTPVGYAVSRHVEREADRFALELTRDNNAAARAFVALQRENLGYPRPGLFHTLFRATHPSLGERVDFSNSYHPWRAGRPLAYGHLFRDTPQPPTDAASGAPR